MLPNISLNASTSYNRLEYPNGQYVDTNPTSPNFGQLRGIPGQEFNQHSWQAQLVQPIVDVAAYYTYKSAKALKAQAAQDYAASEQNLIVRTVSAYLEVLRSQAALDSTNAEEAAVKRQQEQVQQRFDVGLVAITDVLDATAAYDNVVVRRIQAERDQGIRFEDLYQLTGTLLRRGRSSLDDFADRQSRSRSTKTSGSRSRWRTTRMFWHHAKPRSPRSATCARDRQDICPPSTQSRVTTKGSVTTTNWQADRVFSATRPIRARSRCSSRCRSIKAAIRRRECARRARRLLQSGEIVRNNEWAVSRDTRNLLRTVTTDVLRVQARIKSIKSSESALEATQTGYEVGTRNIVDVLQAQQRLYLSQFDYADSRYNYVRDLMLLKQTAGTLNSDDVAKLNAYSDAQQPIRRITTISETSTAVSAP